jgi:carotenoid cleavage dioxygenase
MLYVADRDGKLIRQEEFTMPFPGVAHDFAMTRDHVIFPVMPLTVDIDRVKAGGDFYAWDYSHNPTYGIMPRTGTTADIRWFEVPRGNMGHVMNAWGEGNVVHLDATISPGNSFTFLKDVNGAVTEPGLGSATMTRLSFDLSSRNDRVDVKPFEGSVGEMPRIDDRFQMSRYRYGFGKSADGIMRLDWETGELQRHLTPGGVTQEPIFVPRSPDAPEGDGWLLCMCSYPAQNRADLLIVDAMDMAAPPVATVKMPFNLPMAFHGMFQAGV